MKAPHLRLLSTEGPKKVKASSGPELRVGPPIVPHGYQLSLPFEPEAGHRCIMIVAMDQVHGIQFRNLLLDLRPKAVVDLRHLIRFDLPGTSRNEIFRHLQGMHTLYVNASLPWHELQHRDLIAEDTSLSQRLNHEVVERQDSPIVLLTAKGEEARSLSAYLHRALSEKSKRSWKIDRLE